MVDGGARGECSVGLREYKPIPDRSFQSSRITGVDVVFQLHAAAVHHLAEHGNARDIRHNQTQPVELGVKFAAIRTLHQGDCFYKGANHTGDPQRECGVARELYWARATFTGGTASAGNKSEFSSPVAITANTAYRCQRFRNSSSLERTGAGNACTPVGIRAFASGGLRHPPSLCSGGLLTSLRSKVVRSTEKSPVRTGSHDAYIKRCGSDRHGGLEKFTCASRKRVSVLNGG